MSQKVLYISPNGYLGGAERFILNACLGHLSSEMVDPHILFFNDGEFVQIAKEKGISCHVIKNTFKLSHPIKLFKAVREITKIVKSIDPDIINSTMPYSQIVMSLVKKPKRTITIWFQHGPVGGTLDKLCASLPCEHMFFNSVYLKDEHYRTANQTSPKYGETIISLGVENHSANLKEADAIRGRHLEGEDQILLVSAGRICDWKGYHNTLSALMLIKDQDASFLEKLKFLIVGEPKRDSDKEYFEKLKKTAESLKGCVEFVGFKKNIKDYYKAADIFIHSSTIPEPFGLVVAEAMAQETLVIGGSVGGVQDILKHEITGLSFSAHTTEADVQLSHLLTSILSKELSSENVEKIMLNAKKLIDEKYSIQSMTKQLEAKYLELTKLKRNE